MDDPLMRWATGLFVSLVLGELAVWLFLKALRRGWGAKPGSGRRIPGWLTGSIERLFFTVPIGANTSGVPAAMIAWLALKLAMNWNRAGVPDAPAWKAYAMSAALAGVLSMLFAAWGGFICAPTVGSS